MTALVVSDIFPPKAGGSGRWFWEIYSRLPRQQFVIAAGQHLQQERFDATHELRVVRLPLALPQWGIRSWQGLTGYWGAIRRLKQLVISHDIDILHVARVLPEGVMALALKLRLGVPYLCYVHGEDVTTARDSREYIFLVRRVLRGAELLIANSRNTRRILCDEWQVPADRVRVLHPGVDTHRFVPARDDSFARHEFDWGQRAVVLTVGRLQKRKGQDQMIRAVRLLKQEFPDLLYAVVGDGEERPELERLVRSETVADHVQFLGEVDEQRLVACYQQCDVFILPNRQVGQDIEGFGMVLLEAQACGKSVIAGASGGTAEAMNAPLTGRIVPCETPESIAIAVAELLRDPSRRHSMGQAGRQWVVANFDWAALAAEAAAVFESVSPALV